MWKARWRQGHVDNKVPAIIPRSEWADPSVTPLHRSAPSTVTFWSFIPLIPKKRSTLRLRERIDRKLQGHMSRSIPLCENLAPAAGSQGPPGQQGDGAIHESHGTVHQQHVHAMGVVAATGDHRVGVS